MKKEKQRWRRSERWKRINGRKKRDRLGGAEIREEEIERWRQEEKGGKGERSENRE